MLTIKLEYLAVYGRASMGVPVGELHFQMAQRWMAPTADCDWSAIGPPTHFLSRTHRNVTTYVATRSVREVRLKSNYVNLMLFL